MLLFAVQYVIFAALRNGEPQTHVGVAMGTCFALLSLYLTVADITILCRSIASKECAG